MNSSAQPNYKELFERMEKTIDDATTRLLDVYSDCQVILEDCGERESPFSKEALIIAQQDTEEIFLSAGET